MDLFTNYRHSSKLALDYACPKKIIQLILNQLEKNYKVWNFFVLKNHRNTIQKQTTQIRVSGGETCQL